MTIDEINARAGSLASPELVGRRLVAMLSEREYGRVRGDLIVALKRLRWQERHQQVRRRTHQYSSGDIESRFLLASIRTTIADLKDQTSVLRPLVHGYHRSDFV